jgi:hypothetical protein
MRRNVMRRPRRRLASDAVNAASPLTGHSAPILNHDDSTASSSQSDPTSLVAPAAARLPRARHVRVAADAPSSQSTQSDSCELFDSLSSQSSLPGLPLPLFSNSSPFVAASAPPLPRSGHVATLGAGSASRRAGADGRDVSHPTPLRPGLRDRSNRMSVVERWDGL